MIKKARIKKPIKLFYVVLFFLLFAQTVFAKGNNAIEKIEIFTIMAHPISFGEDKMDKMSAIYYLDMPQQIIQKINNQINQSSNKDIAAKIFTEHKKELIEAYRGLYLANEYHLTKIPAFVFNGEAVVYGGISLSKAIMEYQKWSAR